jgi:lysophospholipid acyltransferase (LPLAT)-like uncharacterized protein
MSPGAHANRRGLLRRLRHRVRRGLGRPLALMATAILPPIYMLYMRLVFATSRVEENDIRRIPEICDETGGAVALLWHEEVFPIAYAYGVHLGFSPHALASAGDAGEVITRILERCGFCVFRGGSTRHHSRRRAGTLIAMVRHMQKQPGTLYALTVDGSKGPAYRMKPGGLIIASRCQKPIVLVRNWYRRSVRLPTWDRTAIPLPFNHISFSLRGPYDPPVDSSDDPALDRFLAFLEDELIDLAAHSYDEMGHPRPAQLRPRKAALGLD